MGNDEFQKIWQDIELHWQEARVLNLQSWVLNLESYSFLNREKARRVLHPLRRHLVWGIVLGILINALFATLIYQSAMHFQPLHLFLIGSFGAIFAINAWAVGAYIRNRIRLNELDFSEEITINQARLAQLRLSMLQVPRILFLQLPFYCTWFINRNMVESWSLFQWLLLAAITIAFILLSIWIYIHLNPKKAAKKWFRLFTGNALHNAILRASEYYREIQDFQNSQPR